MEYIPILKKVKNLKEAEIRGSEAWHRESLKTRLMDSSGHFWVGVSETFFHLVCICFLNCHLNIHSCKIKHKALKTFIGSSISIQCKIYRRKCVGRFHIARIEMAQWPFHSPQKSKNSNYNILRCVHCEKGETGILKDSNIGENNKVKETNH